MIEISELEKRQLISFIKTKYGINLDSEKESLLTGRLSRVLLEKKFSSFSEYYRYIVNDKSGEAISTLVDNITTNHTFFMREEEHLNFFKNTVLPEITKGNYERDLRIWSAGCSSGEEPYTLAMIIDDYFGPMKIFWDTKILATDISNRVLKAAVRGCYKNDNIKPLPEEWKRRYFRPLDAEHSVIVDEIKKEVIFRNFNLMEEIFPFKKKFHVIFCKNVMIYFDNKTISELINKFYNALEVGGYLFIGQSESLDRNATEFEYVIPSVYKKTC